MTSFSLQDKVLLYLTTRDNKIFEEIYNTLVPRLKYFVHKMSYKSLRDWEVDDIVSISICKAYNAINTYSVEYKFSTWIYNITKNETLIYIKEKNRYTSEDVTKKFENFKSVQPLQDRHYRNSFIEKFVTFEDEFHDYSEDELLDNLYERVLEAAELLPDSYKIIFIDKDINKMKGKDIAEKHGITHILVRVRTKFAREKIKEILIRKKSMLYGRIKENLQLSDSIMEDVHQDTYTEENTLCESEVTESEISYMQLM